MKRLENGLFVGERALFNSHGLSIHSSRFEDGESPLKESSDIELYGSTFDWKYPLWYCESVRVEGCVLTETARSGIWYTKGIEIKNSQIDAPKTFRRSEGITITNTSMKNALETLWFCKDVKIKSVSVVGDYFGLGCENVTVENFEIDGNYIFDGAKNIVVKNARLNSKDAFWNTENVTVYDSQIVGEYLGWNSKNVRFVNCTIESNQGLCYMDGVVLENCTLKNTDLAFEYSTVDADIVSDVVSVKNPISGKIHARAIHTLIMEEGIVDPERTIITTDE